MSIENSYVPLGAEITVNTTYARTQAQSDTARLANGNFIVTWIDADFNTSAGRFLRAQVYAPDGTPVGGETTLATLNGGIQPTVAGLANGGYVVSWVGLGTVMAQVYDARGVATAPAFAVTPISASNFGRPDVAALAGGGFAIAWDDARTSGGDTSGQGVHLRVYNATGAAVGGDVLVNVQTSRNQADAAVTGLADGSYVVTWTDRGASAGWLVKGQIFSASGARVGTEFTINASGASFYSSVESSVTTLSNGNFAVAWYDNVHHVQVFTAGWARVGPEVTVTNGLTGIQTGPVISALADGGYAIAWTRDGAGTPDGSGRAIYVQAFTADGQANGGPQLVNTQTNGDQIDPSIVGLANGSFAITWTDLNGSGADDDQVKAQVFGHPLPLAIVSGGGGDTAAVSVAEHVSLATTVKASGGSGAIVYQITGGVDAFAFTINSATGALSFAQPTRFEAPADKDHDNVYSVVVTASDGTNVDSQGLLVTVTDVNEAPVIVSGGGADIARVSVNENSGDVMVLAATDPDGSTPQIAIAGGEDAALFTIDAATGMLRFKVPPDFETPADFDRDNVYTVLISATDGQYTDIQKISVTVGNFNEGLSITSAAAVAVAENGMAVGNVVARDLDGDAPRYSVVGGADAASFAIDPLTGALTFVSAPDFEAPRDAGADNVYDVVVRASDGQFVEDQHLAVTVTNVNEGIFITSPASVATLENGTAAGTVTAFDPDGTSVTYSIAGGADAASFTIDAATGALSFVSAPDFEARADANGDNVYDVIVRASDGELADDRALSVTVGNVNEGLSIVSAATASVAENGTAVATVVAHDQDGDAPAYAIAGGADAALFAVDAATGALSFVSAPDFEAPRDADGNNVYDVVVRATDGQLADDQHVAVTVTNVNEGLSIVSLATAAIAENGKAVATVVAHDLDGDAPVYSIAGGADTALFAIDPATGALTFVAAPDFEAPRDADGNNVYEVVVRATDGQFADEQMVSVTVGNVNEGISIASSAAFTSPENGTAVGVVAAVDPDGTPTTYTIAGGADAALFTIDPVTGALSFISVPNFEAPGDSDGDNIYQVVVRATDGEVSAEQSVAVTVANVNEGVSITSPAALSVAENGLGAGAVVAVDVDGDPVAYAIAGGADAALFTIDAGTGALSFRDAPDHEAPADAGRDNVYDVVVSATDGSFTATQAVAVTVTDVNDPVVFDAPTRAVSMAENGRAAAVVTATDPDGAPVSYSIAGGADAAWFTIDPHTGALELVTAPDYEHPADAGHDNVYDVIVAASDGVTSATQAISVAVTNVDEPVALVSYGGAAAVALTVSENGKAVGQVAGVDGDGSAVSYAITGGADAALFVVDAVTGALSFAAAPNYEAPADVGRDNVYDVQVSARSGSSSATQAFAVHVANVVEPVSITSNGGGAGASLTVAENGRGVTTVVAANPDGGALTYAIAGGADAARFTIDARTGALQFIAAPDYEAPTDADHDNVYAVVVSAGNGVTTATQALSVTVGNVDEGVRLVSYAGSGAVALTVAENGRAVGQVAAVDLDGDKVSYAIAGGADAALFTIDAATGALSFTAAPDFEAKADAGRDNVYDVAVMGSSGTFSATQVFAVTVANVDEAVAITSLGGGSSGTMAVAENSRLVGTVTAVDPDGGAVSYAIAGGADAARFTIDAKTGVLQFVTAPDYEAPSDVGADHVYDVTVKASDGTTSDLQAISVSVLNVQDGVTITGSNGADTINGTASNPALRTTAAEDTVSGGDGNDTIEGLGGDDILSGDAGKDVLTGGAGADRLTGGAAADQFVYNAVSESTAAVRDVITDFSHAQGDRIALSGIDANTLVAGDQAFTFIGSAAFTHTAGQLRFESDGHGNTIVSGDVNGDGIADFQVQLVGTINLVSSDFIL